MKAQILIANNVNHSLHCSGASEKLSKSLIHQRLQEVDGWPTLLAV